LFDMTALFDVNQLRHNCFPKGRGAATPSLVIALVAARYLGYINLKSDSGVLRHISRGRSGQFIDWAQLQPIPLPKALNSKQRSKSRR
jgi:hypothetical protein